MPQPTNAQLIQNEGRALLALSAINQNQFLSVRSAANTYNVSEITLRRRRAGITFRRDYEPNSKKLTKREEEVIV